MSLHRTLLALLGAGSFFCVGCPKVACEPSTPARTATSAVSAAAPPAALETQAPAATRPPPGPIHSGSDVEVNGLIAIDQFGYRPELTKVAVLVDPQRGMNSKQHYQPGAELEVRSFEDGHSVFKGARVAFRNGAIDEASGDRGFWFDFSALRTDGSYFIYDPQNHVRSQRFEIGRQVYRDVLKAAERAFYFNRANFAKRAPYACVKQKCWVLGADNVGPRQDREARSVRAREDASSARDLSGGWWDAGDTNKYVTFAQAPVHQLLTAYWEKPGPFSDDFGIPESGNGLPDLIDELKVELDWLQKMQPNDLGGGVLIKVGNVDYGDPVPDQSKLPRYYYPGACSSATIAAASMFAHAALVFKGFPALAGAASELTRRAVRAWDHYQTHPHSDACDDGTIKAGDADRSLEEQNQIAVVAAVYLFAQTAEGRYDEYVQKHYGETRPFKDERWSAYDPDQGDALLFYTTLAHADGATRQAILAHKNEQLRSFEFYGFHPDLDLYRAYVRPDSYHWGSNMPRANFGNTNYDVLQFALVPPEQMQSFRDRVAGLLHSFHGVNALQLVYLSNMQLYGAEKSVSEIYHAWFRDGNPKWDSALTSELGPAPGYVPGGPNKAYCTGSDSAEHKCGHSELKRQPPAKTYLDFNTAWDPSAEYDQSWELTEPAIYYQASYVKLVSKFVD